MSNLFDWVKSVRATDPSTSRDAAIAAKELAGRHHALILRALSDAGHPMTSEEISDALDGEVDKVAVNKRMCELERGSLVEKTAEKHANRSRRMAFCYQPVGRPR